MDATWIVVAASVTAAGWGLFSGYLIGEERGQRAARDEAKSREGRMRDDHEAECAYIRSRATERESKTFCELVDRRHELSAKQRRLRGILAEARRWKAVATAHGWKRETRKQATERALRELE